MAKAIGTLGFVPTVSIGGATIEVNDNFINLGAWINGGNNASTPRLGNGTSGYQVPVGKTLVILAAKSYSDTSATTNLLVKVGYADNDVGFNAGDSTALTNPVYKTGDADEGSYIFSPPGVGVEPQENSFYFEIPAGKYVAVVSGAIGRWNVQLYGYLK